MAEYRDRDRRAGRRRGAYIAAPGVNTRPWRWVTSQFCMGEGRTNSNSSDGHNGERRARFQETGPEALRAILVGVELVGATTVLTVDDSLAELAQLARTMGVDVVGTARQKQRSHHPATFVGSGKVEEIRELAAEHRA